jgi:hypothetical protein
MTGTGLRDDTTLGAIRLDWWAASDWNGARNTFGIPGRLRRNPHGKAPSAEGTRQTWFLVRQAVAKTPKLVARPAAMVQGPTRPVTASGERQPALLPSAAPDERTVDLTVTPPRQRKRLELRSARPLAEGEAPKDDGSELPRPIHPNRKD